MKKLLLSFAVIALLITVSCKRGHFGKEDRNVQDQTPEVFNDKGSDLSIYNMSKRSYADVIEKLYLEAVSADPQLNEIDNQLDMIIKMKNDSLDAYNKYVSNNKSYYSVAGNYIDYITDSTLKMQIRSILNNMETKHHNNMKEYYEAMDKLEEKERILDDYVILMKLMITHSMMENYQRNERPEINTIRVLTNKYDSLIQRVKPYSENKK